MPPSPTSRRPAPLGARDWPLLVEAALALSTASIAVALVPFRRIARSLSAPGALHPITPSHAVARAVQAIEGWARRMPWKTVCFQKGLALHWMLRRRGIDSLLHYGVGRHAELGLRAHVWISVGGDIVMGGDVAHEFTCLASFPSADAAAVR